MNISFLFSRRDYAALLSLPLILLDRFGGDSGGRLGAVVLLNVA